MEKKNKDIKNLYEEICEILANKYITEKEILFVNDSARNVSGKWESFKERIKDFEYDNGYGIEEVNTSLQIVGKDWWLERHSYDGSEWFEFKSKPKKNKNGIVSHKERDDKRGGSKYV